MSDPAAPRGTAVDHSAHAIKAGWNSSRTNRLVSLLIEFTLANRKLIRYLAERPDHVRTFDNISGLNATLLAMATLHMGHYRDQYRNELSPRALAWLFFNIAVATTLRYIESDDPISREELRAGLKFASTGLLAGVRN